MDLGQAASLGRGRNNNRDRNSITFDRFVYTSNKSYQRLDGDDVVDVDAAEGAGDGGGNVTKNCSASSRRVTSNKTKKSNLRALDNKQQQPVIVENKPKNVKFAPTIDSKQPKQKQPVVKGGTKTIRKDEDSEEDDVEVEVVIEEVSVRVPAKINVHERQTNKRNLLTTMQQLRRMRLLKQHHHHHHHPLIDEDDSDDDIVCEEEEESGQSDDDSLLGAKCETTDVLSSQMSKVMSNQRGAFSGVTFSNVKVGMGCHEVSDDDETIMTTRTESPLSHEGGEELDDTLILEDVIVDIAESFRRFAMCEDLFDCGPQQQQQQQKIKRRKVMTTTDDKKQQQQKNETSYCTCNEVLL